MQFINNQSGAVTVDWVVLTTGLVGLGVASMAVVSAGVQDTAGDIDEQLQGQGAFDAIATSFMYGNTVYSSDFENGADGWWGDYAGAYDFLGGNIAPQGTSDGSEELGKTFSIPEDAKSVQVTFDLYAMDSLDNWSESHHLYGTGQEEGPRLYVDGVEVARAYPPIDSVGGSLIEWHYNDVPGVTVETTPISTQQMGGHGSWQDSLHQVTITVDDPNATMDVGFGLKANQNNDGTMREGIAVDNFRTQVR